MDAAIISIIVAVITSAGTLIGVFVNGRATRDKVSSELRISQEVTNTKLEHITEIVREHNAITSRIPVLEEKVKELERRVIALDTRVSTIETDLRRSVQ